MKSSKTKTVMSIIYAIFLLFAVSATAQESEIKTELLWQFQIGELSSSLTECRYSPTEKYIHVWNAHYGSPLDSTKGLNYILDAKSGEVIFSNSDGRILTRKSDEVLTIRDHNLPTFIYNDTILLLQSEDMKTINFHSFPDMKIIAHLDSADGNINFYSISSDQKRLVALINDSTFGNIKIILWNLETKKIIKEKRISKYGGDSFDGRKVYAENINYGSPVFVPNSYDIMLSEFHTYILAPFRGSMFGEMNVNSKTILNHNLDSIYSFGSNSAGFTIAFTKDGKHYFNFIKEFNKTNSYLICNYETKQQIKNVKTNLQLNSRFIILTSDLKYIVSHSNYDTHRDVFFIRVSDGKKVVSVLNGQTTGLNLSKYQNEFIFTNSLFISKYSFSDGSSVNNNSQLNYLTFPTPIKSNTPINLTVEKESNIKIVLTDERGKEISTLTDQFYNIGTHTIDLYSSNLPSGLYFLSLTDNNGTKVQKIIIER